MNQHLETILNFIQQAEHLSNEVKAALLKAAKAADKELEITAFKLDRTEKVKRTTAILLEETIEELEHKRKAVEAQNRELEMEASLERVRTVAMSMVKADDLLGICEVMFRELKKLGFVDLRNAMINMHYDEKKYLLNYDYAYNNVKTVTKFIYGSHPIVNNIVHHANQNSEGFTEMVYRDNELNELRNFRKQNGEADDERLDNIDALYYYFYAIETGALGVSAYNAIGDEHLNVLKRFRNVFDLAYKRYIDITNAEAQAREAQIEVALEKIRSRSLAMHHSDELKEVMSVMFKKLTELEILIGTVGILLFDEKTKNCDFWLQNQHQEPGIARLPYDEKMMNEDNYMRDYWDAKTKGESFFNRKQTIEQKNRHFEYVFAHNDIPQPVQEYLLQAQYHTQTFIVEKNSALLVDSWDERIYSMEQIEVLKRVAKVFEQAYIRFLDLQKAEAQAREAQIEAALERVRSRSMGMQKSDELKEVIKIVYKQLVLLKINIDHSGFVVDYTPKGDWHFWIADEQDIPSKITHPYFESVWAIQFNKAKEKDTDFFATYLNFEEKNKFYRELLSYVPGLPETSKEFYLNCPGLAISTALLEDVALYIENFAGTLYSEEENVILMRFGKVFQQTYTRFLDLQKAEAQARESQIQLALERVRARTMAMQHSSELREIAAAVHEQLQGLGFTSGFCSIVIMDRITGDMTWWMFFPGKEYPESYDMHFFEHPFYLAQLNKWKQGEKYSVVEVSGEEKKSYDKHVFSQTEFVKVPIESQQFMMSFEKIIFSNAYMKHGAFSWGVDPIDDEHAAVLQRFANVFEQCYTRFLDLQKAEAQAREAQIEAALERVRSRTLAMQKSDELAETAAVLFQQLIALGIEPNRLYIAIVKDAQGLSEFWITEEDGTKVSTAFSADLNNNESFIKMLEGWKQQQKSLVIDMQGEELQNYFHHLTSLGVPFKGGLQQKRRVQDIAYFSKGFIGMASPDEQPAETRLLLERFAAVFNLTFTRFNDLKIAEAHALQAEKDLIAIKEAKQKAEEALTELQATQKQLIQSEKMASLGELTAGIAHEIQNPLNFVNNFSEVNTELIEELKEGLQQGNTEEVIAIANDIKENEQKINHHGKRAEAIVKGMLQHSRSSSNVKEPTDINTLAHEYLRLAYHGLRAKDKSFNATLNTTYDDGIGMINIIPQDIGRVTLNLITNAFYAVNEKNKNCTDKNYEPTVSINTKKLDDKVLISVTDNGNGIPQKILDKIFQPFFTTKPTGQGTGLGLSLSYDIVKAHGGEIKVESKEGEGSLFIIMLPA